MSGRSGMSRPGMLIVLMATCVCGSLARHIGNIQDSGGITNASRFIVVGIMA
jgi:hypothetical protein